MVSGTSGPSLTLVGLLAGLSPVLASPVLSSSVSTVVGSIASSSPASVVHSCYLLGLVYGIEGGQGLVKRFVRNRSNGGRDWQLLV